MKNNSGNKWYENLSQIVDELEKEVENLSGGLNRNSNGDSYIKMLSQYLLSQY